MKKSPIRSDLGLRFLVLYLLFLGPVLLVALFASQQTSRQIEKDAKSTDLTLAQAIAQETEITLGNALEAVYQLGTYSEVLDYDIPKLDALFKNVLSSRPDTNLIYRLDQTGEMIFHYPTGPGSTLGVDFSFRPYFIRAKKTTEPLISAGRESPTTKQAVATAVMPLWSEVGEFMGVVATNIKLEALSQSLIKIAGEQQPNSEFQTTIIDSNQNIVAHADPEKLLQPISSYHSTDLENTLKSLEGSGNLIAEDSSGEKILYSYAEIPCAGWSVLVHRPTRIAFSTSVKLNRGLTGILIIYIFIGIIFWLALSSQVLRPLERLAVFSHAVASKYKGDKDTPASLDELANRPDQIGHLTHSLTRMEATIQARLNELSTLLETSASVVSTLDPSLVLDRILQQVERLLKADKSAIVALDENRGLFRAQATHGLSKQYSDQLIIIPDEPQSITLQAIRRSEPLQISDTEIDPAFIAYRDRARSEGYRSLLVIPFKTQHTSPSALLIYRADPHYFTEREINLLTSFANHAAMAINNAALFSRSDTQLHEQTGRLEALIQSLESGLILQNLDGEILYANRRIGDYCEMPEYEIIGSRTRDILQKLCKKTHSPSSCFNDILLAIDNKDITPPEFTLVHQDLDVYLRCHTFAVTDEANKPIGYGLLMHDVTADRKLDKMKSNLMSTVSHELRTPLAAIKGYTSTLLADDVNWDKKSQKEFLTTISKETDRLTMLVKDLLDLNRIEAGSLHVKYQLCDLESMINQAAKSAHPAPGEKLKVHFIDEIPQFYADRRQIEVVLRNLVENASKYSSNAGPILITAAIEGKCLIVSVNDHGPGIPPEHQSLIFDSFYRIDNSLSRTTSGSGLGLAISKGFIEAHDGKIWVEDSDNGANVSFSIPISPKKALDLND